MYDVIIVGGGPAGFSAAVNLRARGKTCLIISSDITANPLARSPKVDNYVGMAGVTGLEMLQKMKEDALSSGAEFRHGRVLSIAPYKDRFMVAIGNDVAESRRVILAIGAAIPKRLEGEDDRIGRGVSYCATCDGMLYRSKRALVIGDADDLAEEAALLTEIGVQVTVVGKRRPDGLAQTISFVQATPKAVEEGEPITLRTDGGTLSADVVFALRNAAAPATLISGLATDGNRILVDEHYQTNIPGVYAAGDCVGKPYQVATAVAQGLLAAFAVTESFEQ
ncbi:MAG: NAD(P)/FAD-dependent oxidoreductase [Ruminococcaceae bacterium]|nr:NAD(P)/FAD-dependent oxidoreductase [Oscillospiraceae bacterium]